MRRFRPMVSRRSPSGTHFAELFLAPGPEVIGQTGDNSYGAMFGRNWLLVWDRDTGFLHAFQETSGEWLEVTEELPPVFDSPAPEGSRRWSLAFDQAARVILAYEDAEGVVRVTRWDPSLNQYVQNVTFAGADPCVVIDAAWSHDVPNSDVLLFYLSADRERVMCRVQRDVYAVEHELWTFDEPVILDRVMTAPIRYQVLISDAEGTPLPDALVSDPYPYLGRAEMAGAGYAPYSGDYTQVVLVEVPQPHFLTLTVAPPAEGSYADPIIEVTVSVEEMLAGVAMSDAGGAYVSVIINYELDGESIEADATGPTGGGDYVLAVLSATGATQHMAGAVTGPVGGSYDAA